MRDDFRMILPSLSPVGGIQKCLDYANHALSLGYRVTIYAPHTPTEASDLFKRDDFAHFAQGGATFLPRQALPFDPACLYFFSLPTDFRYIEPLVQRGLPTRRIIHIIQNTRHASVSFQDGYAIRLLSRPMSRISINGIVRDAIDPFLYRDAFCETIPLGHNTSYFRAAPRTLLQGRKVRVGYMTWKSDIGDRIAKLLAGDTRFSFTAVRKTIDWPHLRKFYADLDVFLCAPNPQEGFYLPGLEAMAAGTLVLSPDVQGNMAYCRFGENCMDYEFDDAQAGAAALQDLVNEAPERIAALQRQGLATAEAFSLDQERACFGTFIDQLVPQVNRPTASGVVKSGVAT